MVASRQFHLALQPGQESGAIVDPGQRVAGGGAHRITVHQRVAHRVDQVGEQVLDDRGFFRGKRGVAGDLEGTQGGAFEHQVIGATVLRREPQGQVDVRARMGEADGPVGHQCR